MDEVQRLKDRIKELEEQNKQTRALLEKLEKALARDQANAQAAEIRRRYGI